MEEHGLSLDKVIIKPTEKKSESDHYNKQVDHTSTDINQTTDR